MSVELKVVLVSDDETQQQAFNNHSVAPSSPQAIESPPVQPSQPAQQPVVTIASTATNNPAAQPAVVSSQPSELANVQPASKPTQPSTTPDQTSQSLNRQSPVPPSLPDWYMPPNTVEHDQKLIDTLEKLIDAINELAVEPESSLVAKSGSQTNRGVRGGEDRSLFQSFVGTIGQKIDAIAASNTRIGELVSKVSDIGGRARLKVGRVASAVGQGLFGRKQGAEHSTVVTPKAVGARSVAGSAAASSLLKVGAAAGVAAITMKVFMDSVSKASQELDGMSADIASQSAQHESRMNLNRLERAKRIGPEVASIDAQKNQWTEQMYKINTNIQDMLFKLSPIVEGLLSGVNAAASKVASVTEYAAIQADVTASALKVEIAKLTATLDDDVAASKELTDATKRLDDFLKKDKEDKDTQAKGPEIDQFFKELLMTKISPSSTQAPRRVNGGAS